MLPCLNGCIATWRHVCTLALRHAVMSDCRHIGWLHARARASSRQFPRETWPMHCIGKTPEHKMHFQDEIMAQTRQLDRQCGKPLHKRCLVESSRPSGRMAVCRDGAAILKENMGGSRCSPEEHTAAEGGFGILLNGRHEKRGQKSEIRASYFAEVRETLLREEASSCS